MAIKKSELYSSIWASCDELRGGMDASQYKDYVLFMLFIKYVSDKYADSDDFAPPVTIPQGASFKNMIALKGKSDIGDKINTQIIQPLIDANERLARSDFPDFNDPNKLGEGKAMVDRLTSLVGIFQKPGLDFSKNRADHDDILGDAYEDLMEDAQVLSIHVPLNDETRGRIDGDMLARMPEGAVLINTARGAVVDEAALLAALDSGHLAGAGLDVVADEFSGGTSQALLAYARDHGNLIITPHMGGATVESMEKAEVFMAQKLARFLESGNR